MLNSFNAIVWATPLLVGFAVGECLRRRIRPIVRLALWIIYIACGWGWVWIWHSINSGGSGRFAVEQLIFELCVWGTTMLGAIALGWAEFSRRATESASSAKPE